jgi:hypothetical protein
MRSGEMEEFLGRKLSPALIYNYPSIEALANHPALQSEENSRELRSLPSVTESKPIAVIGIGCGFPGTDNPESFWQILRSGTDAVTEIPMARWNLDDYFDSHAGNSVTALIKLLAHAPQ